MVLSCNSHRTVRYHLDICDLSAASGVCTSRAVTNSWNLKANQLHSLPLSVRMKHTNEAFTGQT